MLKQVFIFAAVLAFVMSFDTPDRYKELSAEIFEYCTANTNQTYKKFIKTVQKGNKLPCPGSKEENCYMYFNLCVYEYLDLIIDHVYQVLVALDFLNEDEYYSEFVYNCSKECGANDRVLAWEITKCYFRNVGTENCFLL